MGLHYCDLPHTSMLQYVLMEGKENKKMGWKGMSSIDCFIYFACNIKQLPYFFVFDLFFKYILTLSFCVQFNGVY